MAPVIAQGQIDPRGWETVTFCGGQGKSNGVWEGGGRGKERPPVPQAGSYQGRPRGNRPRPRNEAAGMERLQEGARHCHPRGPTRCGASGAARRALVITLSEAVVLQVTGSSCTLSMASAGGLVRTGTCYYCLYYKALEVGPVRSRVMKTRVGLDPAASFFACRGRPLSSSAWPGPLGVGGPHQQDQLRAPKGEKKEMVG